MTWERIRTEISARVGVLTIDYPPVNALGYQTWKELGEAVEFLLGAVDVKVLVVTGAGRFFVAGADINELQTHTPATVKEFNRVTVQALNSIAYGAKPVVCAINGAALGGGLELALACDVRLAGKGVKLGCPEINLGVMPGAGGTQRLPRIVGVSRAKELIFTGRLITANEAFELGIIEAVVPSEQLMEEALKLAKTMAEKSSVALRVAKRAIMEGIDIPLPRALELEQKLFCKLLDTEDKAEGIAAFLDKRLPRFKDR